MINNRRPLYLREIALENVRCFGKKQTIHFLDEDGLVSRWNLILGQNGSGKTTLLKSIVLACTNNRKHFKEIDLTYFHRKKESNPKLQFKLGNSWNDATSLTFDEREPNKYLLDWGIECEGPVWELEGIQVFGYGAARIIGDTRFSKEKNAFPSINLFDDSAELINAEEWLVQQEYLGLKRSVEEPMPQGDYVDRVRKIIIKLFKNEITNIEIRTDGSVPKAFFETKFGWVKLHDLSLGYKSLIAWMVDLASRLMELNPHSKNPLDEPAIVLVDEIDLHLHPSFQRELISFLTKTYKNVQFIVTAHSPLIVQAMEKANIILLDRVGSSVKVTQNPIDIQNWRVDQILTSDLFGLTSAHSKENEKLLEKRRKILAQPELTGEDEKKLEELRAEMERMPIGETSEEIIGFQKIKEFARKIGSKGTKTL